VHCARQLLIINSINAVDVTGAAMEKLKKPVFQIRNLATEIK